MNILLVAFSMMTFSAPEELSFSVLLISRIPYRNIARPPSRPIILKTSIDGLYAPNLS